MLLVMQEGAVPDFGVRIGAVDAVSGDEQSSHFSSTRRFTYRTVAPCGVEQGTEY